MAPVEELHAVDVIEVDSDNRGVVMTCPECGDSIRPGLNFCTHCGASLQPETSDPNANSDATVFSDEIIPPASTEIPEVPVMNAKTVESSRRWHKYIVNVGLPITMVWQFAVAMNLVTGLKVFERIFQYQIIDQAAALTPWEIVFSVLVFSMIVFSYTVREILRKWAKHGFGIFIFYLMLDLCVNVVHYLIIGSKTWAGYGEIFLFAPVLIGMAMVFTNLVYFDKRIALFGSTSTDGRVMSGKIRSSIS